MVYGLVNFFFNDLSKIVDTNAYNNIYKISHFYKLKQVPTRPKSLLGNWSSPETIHGKLLDLPETQEIFMRDQPFYKSPAVIISMVKANYYLTD